MAPLLRKYFGTYGKHVGDGMVYYFFPQPDCNYIYNALSCAHEMKEIMRSVSRKWQNRKSWVNDLKLNIGLDEGEEWFGTYHTPTHLEFTALGDTIKMVGRSVQPVLARTAKPRDATRILQPRMSLIATSSRPRCPWQRAPRSGEASRIPRGRESAGPRRYCPRG